MGAFFDINATKDVMQQGRMSRFDTSFGVYGEENGATSNMCSGLGMTVASCLIYCIHLHPMAQCIRHEYLTSP